MYTELRLDHPLAKTNIEKSCNPTSEKTVGRKWHPAGSCHWEQGVPGGGITQVFLVLSYRKDDTEIIEKLRQLAALYPTRGFDDYYGKIRNEGLPWNRK